MTGVCTIKAPTTELSSVIVLYWIVLIAFDDNDDNVDDDDDDEVDDWANPSGSGSWPPGTTWAPWDTAVVELRPGPGPGPARCSGVVRSSVSRGRTGRCVSSRQSRDQRRHTCRAASCHTTLSPWQPPHHHGDSWRSASVTRRTRRLLAHPTNLSSSPSWTSLLTYCHYDSSVSHSVCFFYFVPCCL